MGRDLGSAAKAVAHHAVGPVGVGGAGAHHSGDFLGQAAGAQHRVLGLELPLLAATVVAQEIVAAGDDAQADTDRATQTRDASDRIMRPA